ncbi:hypothetical protein FOBRF1_002488 [Fusarium oxysporum]
MLLKINGSSVDILGLKRSECDGQGSDTVQLRSYSNCLHRDLVGTGRIERGVDGCPPVYGTEWSKTCWSTLLWLLRGNFI